MKKPTSPSKTGAKRTGRTKGVGELVGKIIDPVLKKRGFASRDILENWPIIAPPPYNRTTIPDRLKWRRNKAGTEGALLYLRCREGDRMALSYDHERICEAINRYFGYVLVEAIKLSPEPFEAKILTKTPNKSQNPLPEVSKKIDETIANVSDEQIKAALRELGQGMFSKKTK